jgi:rhodanese-related sulfurtransferase
LTLVRNATEGVPYSEDSGPPGIRQGHREDASIWLPVGIVLAIVDWPIIFYCACPHDEGAKERAKEYADKGFTNVKVLKGGVHAWQEAGFSLIGAGH